MQKVMKINLLLVAVMLYDQVSLNALGKPEAVLNLQGATVDRKPSTEKNKSEVIAVSFLFKMFIRFNFFLCVVCVWLFWTLIINFRA